VSGLLVMSQRLFDVGLSGVERTLHGVHCELEKSPLHPSSLIVVKDCIS